MVSRMARRWHSGAHIGSICPAATNSTLSPSNPARRRSLKSSAPAVSIGPSTTYSGFSVLPDHAHSEAKCSRYLSHVHDNIAGGDAALFNYILNWMASGVQHPEEPGRSSISMRGDPGCG